MDSEQDYDNSSESGDERSGSSQSGVGRGSDYAPSDDGQPAKSQHPDAEVEIAGDFDRLVQNIRLKDTPSTTGLLAKDWDFSIEDQESAFRDDLRLASGVGSKKRRKGRNGRTSGPVLSHQVRSLIGDGNQAYVDNDIAEATRVMQEVIRIEPRAVAAWSVLAQCYEDTAQSKKALQLRIMAAHLRHDGEEWESLARQSQELGYNQQALYCYRKVHSLDPSNVDALWDRASLAKQIGDLRTARHAFLGILKRFPHDLTILSELRVILVDLGDLTTCAALFQQAFEHHRAIYPSGNGLSYNAADPAAAGVSIPGGGFGLMEILVLADLYNTLGEHERAIDVIRKGCRWLQGRIAHKAWDVCEDDREYDPPDAPRRPDEGQPGVMPAARNPLDINARHRIAVARIKMGEGSEGRVHADVILAQNVVDYAPLFAELADAYFERDMYAEARPIYELLGSDAGTSSLHVLLRTAACLRMLDKLPDAVDVYEHIILADPTHNEAKMKLAEIYEIINEPRKALKLVYEVIDSRRKLPKDPSSIQGATGNDKASSLFEEKARAKTSNRTNNRLTPAELRQLEAEKEKEVLRGYRRVTDLWGRLLGNIPDAPDEATHIKAQIDAEREWMFEAEKLIETFRETRNLFTTTKDSHFRGMFPTRRVNRSTGEGDEERIASRLCLDLEHESQARKTKSKEVFSNFRGVSFDDWLRVFMQYCFILSKRDQFEQVDEILRQLLASVAYRSLDKSNTIRITLITCAICCRRNDVVVEQSRRLITLYQFNNDPFRILLASLASGLHSTDSFITTTLSKHIFREIRASDTAVRFPESMKWDMARRYVMSKGGHNKLGADEDFKKEEGDEEPDDNTKNDEADAKDDPKEDAEESTNATNERYTRPRLPTQQNPLISAVYGQLCTAAKSYQSALFYLTHAYENGPEDSMICLSLAVASLGRAMQRQSDNRHHLVTQAMGFLTKYRRLRGPMGWEEAEEVEYNFGRAFQQLGLNSYAVRHYEQVLELAEKRGSEEPGFSREAAYNLAIIYTLTGATPLAQALYRRWLSI